MPSITDKIENYTVTIQNRKNETTAFSRRQIDLAGQVLAHGIQTRYRLFFGYGQATNVGVQVTSNYFQHQVYVWLPFEEFATIYDLLRNEAPVMANYALLTDDVFNPATDEQFSFMHNFNLGTGEEVVGEGSADDDADPDRFVAAVTRFRAAATAR